MCFGCSKELSHRDGSFEYHNIWFDWDVKHQHKQEITNVIFSYAL